MPRFARMLSALLLSCIVAAPAVAAALEVAPVALPPEGPPWERSYQVRQGRVLEAEAKARFAAKVAAADVKVTPAMADYDVHFYDLVLDVDPVATLLTGTTTVAATVVATSLATVELDLRSTMTVAGVRAAGQPVAHTHAGDLLTITLERTYLEGETFSVEIDYAGDPVGAYFGWDSYNGQPLVWTLSEPYGARHWWPCKDVNTDKADSVALHVTVPDPLVVASNGLLAAKTTPAPAHTTYHWTTRYPIATYLVFLAIHPYVVVSDEYTTLAGGTMPVDHYAIPAWAATAEAGYAVVVDQLTAFAAAFGEYPFVAEKYGHAHFNWGGGMEHQTCASMTYSFYGPWFLAHELGHQWFGDEITCADFHHIWLNEGFATWCEAYWREASEGVQGYRDEMAAAAYFGPGTVYVPDATDVNRIFDSDLSYNKGSWVVHMLRGVLGDADFFAGLRRFREDYGYAAADTEEFRAVMEAVSGRDLQQFFQQWIYGEYYPAYMLSWRGSPVPGGTRVQVRIAQTQANTGVFAMPLDIAFLDDQGQWSRERIDNREQVEWYTFEVPGTVLQVALDPDGWVLCTKTDGSLADTPPPSAPAADRIAGIAPNPFNPRTTIRYELSAPGAVELDVVDLAGRRVRTLVSGQRPAGAQAATWDGRDAGGRACAAGAYFVRLRAGAGMDVRKITLVK